MLTYGKLLFDAKRILGTCEEEVVNRRINEAVELLANKGDFDPYIGVVDISATGGGCGGCIVPLPPEVETVLAVNRCGTPGLGYDQLFNFHLDGPGDCIEGSCRWRWRDNGESPVFANPTTPTSGLYVEGLGTDIGKVVTIYGVDANGDPLGSIQGGVFVPGLALTVAAVGTGVPSTTHANRIDRVSKPLTASTVKLYAKSTSEVGAEAEFLGAYRPEWEEPLFRLIEVSAPSDWFRVLFRRKVPPIVRSSDIIPLHSSRAVMAMLQSLKFYDDGEISLAQGFEATAVRWLEEEQRTRRANLYIPPIVDTSPTILPAGDQLI